LIVVSTRERDAPNNKDCINRSFLVGVLTGLLQKDRAAPRVPNIPVLEYQSEWTNTGTGRKLEGDIINNKKRPYRY
jgi:hypothetical protein